MSQLKRKVGTDQWETVSDHSMPIRLLTAADPASTDYVVVDPGTGARKCTVQQLVATSVGNVAGLTYTVTGTI